ncbi:PPIases accelerate the folding of proteins (By similarity) [Musa troglodytarum]|uniref:Peptidyl-prolyl cis-trans isomerase n=1 Tax=Musa troglodytarum TaxID=320322 RepID=A0A9E7K7P5_9LILI|nr:PPIases accelerate the folding of proteins (By similarity) [Musa troglodytarum]
MIRKAVIAFLALAIILLGFSITHKEIFRYHAVWFRTIGLQFYENAYCLLRYDNRMTYPSSLSCPLDANEFHWHMLMDPVHVLVNSVQLPIKAVTKEFHMTNDGHDKLKVEKEPEKTHRVFLDVDIDGQHLGRIVIGLYGEVVPKTVGEKSNGTGGRNLHYKGTQFHRIVSGFVIQGGDITNGDGRGSESIYGGTFPDENFVIKHSQAGIVSMVNSGPDSNGSQFFITTVKASWLDGEHVAFGRVIQGMDTVFAIEGGAGTYNGKPRKKVIIVDSGEIPKDQWDAEKMSY